MEYIQTLPYLTNQQEIYPYLVIFWKLGLFVCTLPNFQYLDCLLIPQLIIIYAGITSASLAKMLKVNY